jgi:hypothetical protein
MKDFIFFLTKNNNKNLSFFLLICAVILISVIRYNLLEIPFERDEGAYAYLGKQVLLGKIPYVDFFELKFPFMYYSYALLVSLFGYDLIGLHLAFLVLNVSSIVLLFFIVARIFDNISGAIAAMALGLFSLSLYASGYTAQSEHVVVFTMLLGAFFYVFAFEKSNKWMLALSGAFLSIAFLVKQNAVFYIAVLLISILLIPNLNIKKKIFHYGFLLIGAIIPVLITVIIILVQGAFDEMMYWTFNKSSGYISTNLWGMMVENVIYMVKRISQTHMVLWIASVLGLFAVPFIKMKWQYKVLVFIFIMFSYATVFPGLRFFGHYWLFIYPAMALLVGLVYYVIKSYLPKYALAFLPLFIILFSYNVFKNDGYYFTQKHENILRMTYNTDLFAATKKASDLLNEVMNEEDELLVLGFEPQIYVYTQKQAPIRFIWMKQLGKMSDTVMREKYMKIVLDKLYSKPPEYIVYVPFFIEEDYAVDLKAKLDDLLSQYHDVVYVKVGKWGNSKFYHMPDTAGFKREGKYFKIIKRNPV